jgi:hypothetical protein
MLFMNVTKDGFHCVDGVVTIIATGSIIQNVFWEGGDK